METLVTFGLGAGTVLIILGVVVVFKLVKQVKQIETLLLDKIDVFCQNEQILNRRIDREVDRTSQISNDCIRYTDSRVDKLEAKFLSVDKDSCEPTKRTLKG